MHKNFSEFVQRQREDTIKMAVKAAEHQKALKQKGILLDEKDQEKSSSDDSDDSDYFECDE